MRGANVTPAPPRPTVMMKATAFAGDLALAEQAAHAGRMLEAAYTAGDRGLALIWQQAMFAIVNLRLARRFGSDIQSGGGPWRLNGSR